MDANEFQAEIKSLGLEKSLNPAIWSLSQKLATMTGKEVRTARREATKEAENKSTATSAGAAYPDDFKGFTPEQRSEEVAKLLDYKLFTKELTASELRELKDIFNLKAKDQDIHIEQVDFRSIEPELADVVAAVEWQINEYNKEAQ